MVHSRRILAPTGVSTKAGDFHFDAYSIELAKLYLSACSEVEVVCKVLCVRESFTWPLENMDQMRTAVHCIFPELHTLEVLAPKYDLTLHPWRNWATNQNPNWWSDHNKVKHRRHEYFARASFGNTLNAMAGLYCLLLYTYRDERARGLLMRSNPFFDNRGEPQSWFAEAAPLPDFNK